MQQDDPPYLTVGTEVSAKYKGAFCEAKIRKVVRLVKCRVLFKGGGGSHLLNDGDIRGTLRVGATVEAKHPEKGNWGEGTISKIQDQSQYTVVFDDGDITTLRRSALCLKSGRHFNESETLDQLPLTHPEHFSNPVVGGSGRRGARRRQIHVAPEEKDSSEEDDSESPSSSSSSQKGKKKGADTAQEVEFGGVVCVEVSDNKKKGSRDPWFPALVVSPSAQETVKIRVKEECLVRSFKDGRYYTVPKKEITEFVKDQHGKTDTSSTGLKTAIEKAVLYMEKDELPPHWDRDVLFGLAVGDDEDLEDSDDDTMDDAQREKKDNFVAQLYKFMEERGSPINKAPTICNKDLDLHKLYSIVVANGGYSKVTNGGQWKNITTRLGFGTMPSTSTINLVKQAYKKYLLHFEEINKKLGFNIYVTSSGSSKPRNSRSVYRSAGTPLPTPTTPSKKDKDKDKDKEDEEKPGKSKETTETDTGSSIVEPAPGKKEEEQPRRARSRQDSSRSRKDKDEKEEEKKRGRIPKEKAEEKEKEKEVSNTDAPKDIIVAPPSPSPSNKKGPGSAGIGGRWASQRGRKGKESKDGEESGGGGPSSEEGKPRSSSESIGADVKVRRGDRLSVIYPKGDDLTVTYFAKVLDIEEDKGRFFVHYQGWNSRYDEWITRDRISENLSAGSKEKHSQGGQSDDSSKKNKASEADGTEEKQRGKKRGRSATPAPPMQRAPTPSSVTRSKASTAAIRPPSPSGSPTQIKRKRTTSTDTDQKKGISRRGSSRKDSDTESEKSSSTTSSSRSKSKEKIKQQEEKDKDKKSITTPSKKAVGDVMDLNAIRSEMKGVEKIVKSPTTPAQGQKGMKTSSVSPPSLKQQQDPNKGMDVYEFEEDSSEAPKLKMFSPRSPDKKEDKDKTPDDKTSKAKSPPISASVTLPVVSLPTKGTVGTPQAPTIQVPGSSAPAIKPIAFPPTVSTVPKTTTVGATKLVPATAGHVPSQRPKTPSVLGQPQIPPQQQQPVVRIPTLPQTVGPQTVTMYAGSVQSPVAVSSIITVPSRLPVSLASSVMQQAAAVKITPIPAQQKKPSGAEHPVVAGSSISTTPGIVASVPPASKEGNSKILQPFPRKQEIFPHLVQQQQKQADSTSISSGVRPVPPTITPILPTTSLPMLISTSEDSKKKQTTTPRRKSPSKAKETVDKDKTNKNKEKGKETPTKATKKRGRDESPSKSSTSSSKSSSSSSLPPTKLIKTESAAVSVAPSIPLLTLPTVTVVPTRKPGPMLQATLPVPGAEAISKINETISSLMQTVPSEVERSTTSAGALFKTVPAASDLFSKSKLKEEEKKTVGDTESISFSSVRTTVTAFQATTAMTPVVLKVPQPSKASSTTSVISTPIVTPVPKGNLEKKEEQVKPREEILRERPLTPSFLKAQETLDDDEEEEQDMQTPKKKPPVYTVSAKAVLMTSNKEKESESCSNLLCEEEIPGSPTADSVGGTSPSKFEFTPPQRKKTPSSRTRGDESDDEEEEEDDDDSDEDEEDSPPSRPTLLPKKRGGKVTGKQRFPERSQSLVVLHDTSPPSSPESFSTATGSPHIGRGVSPPVDEVGSSKSKEDTISDAESEEDSKSYYSGSPGPSRGKSNKGDSSISKTLASRGRASASASPAKKRRMIRKKSPTDDYARQFGYRGIRSSSGRKIQSSIDLHEAIRGPPPPPVNLSKRPQSEKYNHLYADLNGVTDGEERISHVLKSLQDIREEWLNVKNRIQNRERKERKRKRRQKEKERQLKQEAKASSSSQDKQT